LKRFDGRVTEARLTPRDRLAVRMIPPGRVNSRRRVVAAALGVELKLTGEQLPGTLVGPDTTASAWHSSSAKGPDVDRHYRFAGPDACLSYERE
jgi:hypothetical protein